MEYPLFLISARIEIVQTPRDWLLHDLKAPPRAAPVHAFSLEDKETQTCIDDF